jgi:tight adherence protein B
MGGMMPAILIAVLTLLAVGGLGFAFVGGGDKGRKRVTAIAQTNAKGAAVKGAADSNQQRRRNMQAMLKGLEAKKAEKKARPSVRRRIEMAGLRISVSTFWIASAVLGSVMGLVLFLAGQHLAFVALAVFVGGLGLPRWTLNFLKNRREKAFTREFAPAIEIIVRSVKSGLPVNEALKVVGDEIGEPVGNEFHSLVENLKVGISMEQGLKRMYERMPTAEVNFFGIVMTIQQKSGGNLSEALTNLAGVLRDRKRLHGKIKAMSSEAKASAAIIGSLPPGVLMIVYVTAPDYITLLFTTSIGNIMLMGCVAWMCIGVLVMKKMISFKF